MNETLCDICEDRIAVGEIILQMPGDKPEPSLKICQKCFDRESGEDDITEHFHKDVVDKQPTQLGIRFNALE